MCSVVHVVDGTLLSVGKVMPLMTVRSKKSPLTASATGQVPKSRQTITVHYAVDVAGDGKLSPVGASQVISAPFVFFTPLSPVSEPTKVDAFYCPAWFVVEGLPNRVEFYCDGVIDDDGVGRFRITRLIVEPSDGGAITEIERLPLATMLELAYKAAAVIALHYPSPYDGPTLQYSRGKIVEVKNSRTIVGENERYVEIMENARNVTPAELRQMAGRRKGERAHSRQPRGDDFLEAVAKAYNATKKDQPGRDGTIPRDTQAAMNLAAAGYADSNGLPFGNAWVREAKRRAIAAGYKIELWRQPKGGKK